MYSSTLVRSSAEANAAPPGASVGNADGTAMQATCADLQCATPGGCGPSWVELALVVVAITEGRLTRERQVQRQEVPAVPVRV